MGEKTLDVYTDGGARPNPGSAGYGFSTKVGDDMVFGWGNIGTSNTNNEGELKGALYAIKELPNYSANIKNINLFCDSKYTLGALEKFDTPEQVDARLRENPTMPNAHVIKELITYRNQRVNEGYSFTYNHVFGHTGVIFNEVADMLATRGVADGWYDRVNTNYLEIKPFKDFKTPKTNRVKSAVPNLFCDGFIFDWSRGFKEKPGQRRVHYIGSTSLNDAKPKAVKNEDKTVRYMHYEGERTRLRGVGGISATDRYNVAFLKEPFELLEKVREYQSDIIDKLYETQQFVVYKTDDLFSPRTLELLENDRLHYLMPDKADRGSLYTLQHPRVNVSYIMNPPHLAYKIHGLFQTNAQKLQYIVEGCPEKGNMVLTDISDQVFDTTAKGDKITYKVKPSWNNKDIVIEAKKPLTEEMGKIFCVIGIDTPTRNAFNRMVKDNPRVFMATWPYDEDSFKFAIVIMSDEGEYFHHCNYGSLQLNKKALKKKKGKK